MKTGTQLIAEERERQISQEGWTPENDDKYDIGQLCSAATSYLFAGDCLANAGVMNKKYKCTPKSLKKEILGTSKFLAWPFDDEWLKISDDPIRSLTKAGALIAAEIDRLQRKKSNEKLSD
jgi:hypothetical protein